MNIKEGKGRLKSGFVSIVGRPNVGKSTLLNALLRQKVSIVSWVPQTTRYTIRGILTQEDFQIVFIDTPGFHNYKWRLSLELNSLVKDALQDVDAVLYVVDTSRPPGEEEEAIRKLLLQITPPIVMVLNKIDKSRKYFNSYIELWKREGGEAKIKYFIPVSALKGHNLERILEALKELLPYANFLYPKGLFTDFPLEYRVSDIIREKLFYFLKEEVPHSLAVLTEEIEDKGNFFYLRVKIYVERPSQKQIILGKGGNLIKEVGIRARRELEAILGKKVYLDLWVKVLEDWQENPRILKELGYR